MKKDRVFAIIDGNNLYFKLKELKKGEFYPLNFDYAGLISNLTAEDKLTEKAYYIGAVREIKGDNKSRKMMAHQHKLIGYLIRTGFRVELGYLLKANGYHEKGVDVKIALDILVGSYENLYDKVCLVSSDTDLLPVVKKVRSMGKKVEYIGFSHQPSFGLIKNTTESRLLSYSDIRKFYKTR
jgi:uncharacterized LabA/DUF88 family protein